MIFLVVISLLTACKKESKTNETPKPVPVNFIGNSFLIDFNDCITITDTLNGNQIKVCFKDSVQEYRCFWSHCSLCANGGIVIVKFKIIDENNDTINLSINHLGCYLSDIPDNLINTSFIDTNGLHFHLINVSPYPDTNNFPIPAYNYQIKLLIRHI
jgi:hypothetical protein